MLACISVKCARSFDHNITCWCVRARCCGKSMGPQSRAVRLATRTCKFASSTTMPLDCSRVELHETRQLHVLPAGTARKAPADDLQRAVDKRTRSTEASWTITFGITSHYLCARWIHCPPPHQSKQNLQASNYPEKPASWDQMKVLRSLCPSRDQLAISSQRDRRADPK